MKTLPLVFVVVFFWIVYSVEFDVHAEFGEEPKVREGQGLPEL